MTAPREKGSAAHARADRYCSEADLSEPDSLDTEAHCTVCAAGRQREQAAAAPQFRELGS